METNQEKRKQIPLYKGLIKYFPDALCEVARVSYIGSKQHHPEKEIHWDRDKSQDDLDALMRHLIENGKIDLDGVRHSAKIVWRALAHLQKEIEKDNIREDLWYLEETRTDQIISGTEWNQRNTPTYKE